MGVVRHVAVVVSVSLLATSAHAEQPEVDLESEDRPQGEHEAQSLEEARKVYEEAVKAYEERRYEDAVELFKQANQLKPNAAFSFNIGIAYQDMGDNPMALRHYRDYLRRAPDAPDRLDVLSRIRRLEGLLQKQGVQQVSVVTKPSAATVTIDGNPVGLSPWTGELPPGNHEVVVKLAGYEMVQRDFDLPAERAVDVSVTLVERVGEPITRDIAPKKERPTILKPPWYEDVRPVTWGVLAVGVGSLGVSLFSELSRDSARDDLRDGTLSMQERDELQELAATRRVRADSFLLLGLGMCVTSGVLVYSDLVEADNHRRELNGLSAGCDSGGCAFGYAGRF